MKRFLAAAVLFGAVQAFALDDLLSDDEAMTACSEDLGRQKECKVDVCAAMAKSSRRALPRPTSQSSKSSSGDLAAQKNAALTGARSAASSAPRSPIAPRWRAAG